MEDVFYCAAQRSIVQCSAPMSCEEQCEKYAAQKVKRICSTELGAGCVVYTGRVNGRTVQVPARAIRQRGYDAQFA